MKSQCGMWVTGAAALVEIPYGSVVVVLAIASVVVSSTVTKDSQRAPVYSAGQL